MTASVTAAPTTTASASPSAVRSAVATRPLWLVGVASTVAAAVVTSGVAAVARAADVPLRVASGNADPEVIPTAGFATMVLAMGAVGVILALALNRWAKRPARAFVVVTVVLTVASFLSPVLAAQDATTATRLVLELTHVVAAAIVIPPIAYRLAQRPARP